MSEKVMIERDLLEQISMELAPYSEPAKELRALLTAQPQGSAAQPAPAGEREDVREAAKAYRKGADVATVESGFVAGAAWQRTQSAAPAQPAAQEKCVLGGTGISSSISGAMAEAAQDQGEVQRLREALKKADDHLNNARFFISRNFPGHHFLNGIDKGIKAIDAALSASTGQEMKDDQP